MAPGSSHVSAHGADERDEARPLPAASCFVALYCTVLFSCIVQYMSHSVVHVDVRVVDTDQCVRPCYAMLVLYFKVEYGRLGNAYILETSIIGVGDCECSLVAEIKHWGVKWVVTGSSAEGRMLHVRLHV